MKNKKEQFELHTLKSQNQAKKRLEFTKHTLTAKVEDTGKSAVDSSLIPGSIFSSYSERFNALYSLSESRELAGKYAVNFVYSAAAFSVIVAHRNKTIHTHNLIKEFYDIDIVDFLVKADLENDYLFILNDLKEILKKKSHLEFDKAALTIIEVALLKSFSEKKDTTV